MLKPEVGSLWMKFQQSNHTLSDRANAFLQYSTGFAVSFYFELIIDGLVMKVYFMIANALRQLNQAFFLYKNKCAIHAV